jgi:hypothetical protein
VASTSPEDQKQVLGEQLYPLVAQLVDQQLAGKVTGMLLEMDTTEVLNLIESPETELHVQVAEAVKVLQQAAGTPGAKGNKGIDGRQVDGKTSMTSLQLALTVNSLITQLSHLEQSMVQMASNHCNEHVSNVHLINVLGRKVDRLEREGSALKQLEMGLVQTLAACRERQNGFERFIGCADHGNSSADDVTDKGSR